MLRFLLVVIPICVIGLYICILVLILGYPTGYSQPNTPIKWQRKKVAVSAGSVCPHHTGKICPKPAQTYRGHHARDPRIDVAVADDCWCWGAEAEGEGHAVEAETEQRSRRRARQRITKYELIWLLQQRLHAVSWPHWRLRCMPPLHGHGMGVVRP